MSKAEDLLISLPPYFSNKPNNHYIPFLCILEMSSRITFKEKRSILAIDNALLRNIPLRFQPFHNHFQDHRLTTTFLKTVHYVLSTEHSIYTYHLLISFPYQITQSISFFLVFFKINNIRAITILCRSTL